MQIIKPEGIFCSPRYYPAIKAANTVYVAGRVPVDINGNVVAPNDAARQTQHIMAELQAILAEGGATFQDVTYVHTYFLEEADMPAIHDSRQRYMGDHFPPHTGSKNDSNSWRERGIRVEIELIAVVEG